MLGLLNFDSFFGRVELRVTFRCLCSLECWLKLWHHCLLWACSLARLWLGGKRNAMATTASWWIKAIIGKRKSLWLHTNTHTCTHAHTLAHLIKGKLQSEEDNFLLCYNIAAYITPPHTQSQSQSLSSTAGIQHGCLSLTEFLPFASIVSVNQHRVASLHAHYSLINALITRKLSSIVLERVHGCVYLAYICVAPT